MGDLFNKLSDYGKQQVKSAIKSGTKTFFIKIFTNPYVLLGIAIAVFAIFVFFAITGGIAEIAEAAESGGEMQSATGSSWEQFKRYVATKEGGPNDGTYYLVHDDGAGNPTIGHGLCLYTDGRGHKTAFANYGIDTVQLVNNFLAGNDAKVEMSICDQIWEEGVLRPIFESITASYEDLNLTEYQCYALTDVKYRRGNTNGFQDEYENKWTESDDQYGNYNEANEPFSTDTLFNFFWNGGHSLPGVNTRKQDQWVLFKYGYYRPLGEYWQESTFFSGDLYNDDGSVNDEKIEEYEKALESTYGLVSANLNGDNIGGKYNAEACKAVKGKYYQWDGTTYTTSDGYTGYRGENGLGIYQCTWWANARASEYLGKQVSNNGNGEEVAQNLINAGYGKSVDQPQPNSVISFYSSNSSTGHVAYIEAVDNVNGYYYISHCGSGKSWYGVQKVKIGNGPWSGWSIVAICALEK